MARSHAKVLSVLLAAVLALSALPVPALAQMAEEAMGEETVTAPSGSAPSGSAPSSSAPSGSAPSTQPADAEMGEAVPGTVGENPEPVSSSQEEGEMGEAPVAPAPAPTDNADEQPQTLSAQSMASGTWGTCRWEISDDGVLTIHPGEADSSQPRWYDYKESITSVKCVQEGGRKVKLTEYGVSFNSCYNVKSMDLSGLDTSQVTDMRAMFNACYYLDSLDLTGWDTSRVTDMAHMFDFCSGLDSLDLTGWNTSQVTDMSEMFSGCYDLNSVGNLARWDTSKVTNMYNMFCNCSGIVSFGDLSGWNTSQVTDMSNMFSGCCALDSLDLSGWDTSKVTTWDYMFFDCRAISSIRIGSSYVIKGADMFPDATGYGKWWSAKDAQWFTKDEVVSSRFRVADTYTLKWSPTTGSGTWGTCPCEISADGVLTIRPGEGAEQPDTEFLINGSPWYGHGDSVTAVRCVSEGDRKVVLPSNCSNLFRDFSVATSIDLSGCDASRVTNMSSMFSGCSSLTSLQGLSGWNTPSVTNMSSMFSDCSSLASVAFGSGWDTSRVTNMSSMFFDCSSLSSVTFGSSWNTSRVEYMYYMFNGCTSLASAACVNNFNTSSVKDMRGMFRGCSSLKSIDLSRWNTSSLRIALSMFSGCTSLASLDLSGWNTSNMTLSEHPDIPGWRDMFSGCTSLASFKVGAGYVIKGSDMVPDPTSPNGRWWSKRDRLWYTKDQIRSSQSRVADTYVGYDRFPDVLADAWYAGVVGRATAMGLMSGYSNGKFGPADPITRGQVAVILWNMAGGPAAGAGAKDFSDVKSGAYFYNAVRWASSKGVVSGYGNGKFGPDDKVTREQLAVMLANYAKSVKGQTVTGSAADFASMADKGKVSSWAVTSVGWCFRNEILSGSGGKVNPAGTTARAEAAKMVVVLRDLLG